MKVTHVSLTYFKPTGKYYSSGELDLPWPKEHVGNALAERRPVAFHDALQQVEALLNRGERPGLVNGMDFDVLVTVYTEFGPLSHLFTRDIDGYVGSRSMRAKETR